MLRDRDSDRGPSRCVVSVAVEWRRGSLAMVATRDRVVVAQFRYLFDALFLVAVAAYCVNRWFLRPAGIGGVFARGYFNDVLCLPVWMPVSLGVQRVLRLRKVDAAPSLWEVLQHWAVFSVLFELVIPQFPAVWRSSADPIDVLAYLVGGIVAWSWWRRANSRIGWSTCRR